MIRKKKEIVGILDVLDIAAHVVTVIPDPTFFPDIKSLEHSYSSLNLAKVTEVANKSGKNPYEPIEINNKVSILVKLFASGIHRIPILKNGELQMSISQSSVIFFALSDKLKVGSLKEMGKNSLKSLGLGQVSPHTVHGHSTVIYALTLISKNGFSALPVINSDGVLIGNFSASDLKSFTTEKFPCFADTIEDFLQTHSPNSLKPVSVSDTLSLYETVQILCGGKFVFHRVWITDSNGIPIGVVSFTDIFKAIRDFDEKKTIINLL